jgi:C-terminal processing protease CtpA/Prc
MSEWSVDTLHEHMCKMFSLTKNDIDDRFEAQAEATERALQSAQLAVDKAERLAEIRAETQDRLASERAKAQNEWRASLQDMTSTYMTQLQYEAAHTVLVEKLDRLQVRMDRAEAKGIGQGQLIIWVFLGIASLTSIIGIVLDLSVAH